jgi:hypothetical protein
MMNQSMKKPVRKSKLPSRPVVQHVKWQAWFFNGERSEMFDDKEKCIEDTKVRLGEWMNPTDHIEPMQGVGDTTYLIVCESDGEVTDAKARVVKVVQP